jgi:hypothetical protein
MLLAVLIEPHRAGAEDCPELSAELQVGAL